jgi:hypothetical protein
MQAGAAYRGSVASNRFFWAVATVLALLALATAAGVYISANAGRTVAPFHILAGQDGANGSGSAWNYRLQRSGSQSVEGPAAVDLDQYAGTQRAGTQIVP